MVRKLRRAVLREWEELPEFMRVPEVRGYWEELDRKRTELVCKRIFDVTISSILLLFLVVPMAVIAGVIKADSPGPVFYRQERVTSMASIRYKDESRMLDGAGGDEARIDRMYIREILPRKMKWNLESIRRFSLSAELATMARTVLAVFGREHE